MVRSTVRRKAFTLEWGQGNARVAREKQTIGQCFYSLNRQALANLLSLSENLFAQGQSSKNILELLMPA